YDNDHIGFDQPTYTITATSTEAQLAYRSLVKAHGEETEAIYTGVVSDITALALPLAAKLIAGTATDAEKAALLEQAEAILATGKSELQAKIDELSAKLAEAGYSVDVAAQFQLYYEGKEAEARTLVD